MSCAVYNPQELDQQAMQATKQESLRAAPSMHRTHMESVATPHVASAVSVQVPHQENSLLTTNMGSRNDR